MRKPNLRLALASSVAACCVLPAHAAPTVTVIDVVPNAQSGETNRDSEPNVTVDPADPDHIVITAFTPDPMGSANVPLFISTDRGASWALSTALVTGTISGRCFIAVCDITSRFALNSGTLYIGWLDPAAETNMHVASVANPFMAPALTSLENHAGSGGSYADQPYVSAQSVLGGSGTGDDRVYVANNDLTVGDGKSATVDRSLNAAPPPPSGFSSKVIESQTTTGQDGPSVRAAVAEDGTVYGAFYRWRMGGNDIVVVRDDNWASASPPFQGLLTAGSPGVVAAASVPLDAFGTAFVGTQRVGSQTAIAVDPNNSQRVFVAWGDNSGPSGVYRVHVRSSATGGSTWSADLFTVDNATNPGLAITTTGTVGLLYQQHAGSAPGTIDTHFRLSNDGFASAPSDFELASAPDQAGSYGGQNPIGDYDGLIAIGKDFYGVFSAYNDPSLGTFYPGTQFLRNVNGSHHLEDLAHHAVAGSIDPFFFHVNTVAPSDDFYVRDWSNTPMSHDEGQEPSTDPVFYANSDVWNRREDMPGMFDPGTDRPAHEDPQVAMSGPNYAFVRVQREAAASSGGPQTVSAHFLYADFGLGNPYVSLAAGADPTMVFNQPDTTDVLAAGYSWSLPATHSTHVCMAVQISGPNDPPAGDLTGHAAGWPTTDLMVLNDNNKAQRNMGIYAAMSDGADSTYWALIHNAASFTRDMQIQLVVSEKARRSVLVRGMRLVDAEGRAGELQVGRDGVFVLPRMAPGEDRWISITAALRGVKPGEITPIDFVERSGVLALNGFTLNLQATTPQEITKVEAAEQAALLYRAEALRKLLGIKVAVAPRPVAKPAPGPVRIDELERARADLETANPLAADPLNAAGLLGSLRSSLTSAPAGFGGAYISALNALDAYETMLAKRRGDEAKVLETAALASALVRRAAAPSPEGAVIARASARFAQEYRQSHGDPRLFAGYVLEIAKDQQAMADRLRDRQLQQDALAVASASSTDPAALQGLEHAFLARLNDLTPGPGGAASVRVALAAPAD